MLSMSMKQSLRQGQELKLSGGVTSTLFPKTEEKLEEGDDYIEALKFIARRKNMKRYRSVMDFLFCEMFPAPWRFKAFKYYNNQGPRLINDPDMDDELVKAFDSVLCDLVLEVCVVSLNKERRREWGWSDRKLHWKHMRNISLNLLRRAA